MITIHIWTYVGGAALTPYAVESVMRSAELEGWRLGIDYRVVVIDEGCQPCPSEVRDRCLELGAEWRESNYRRCGNLRGQECIVGILTDMLENTGPGDRDISVKLDADMILRSVSWIYDFQWKRRRMITGTDDRGSVYGMMYALRREAILALLESLRVCPVHKVAPEDQVIGFRTRLLFGEGAFLPVSLRVPGQLPNSINSPEGLVAPYLWSCPEIPLASYRDCVAVNLGTSLRRIPTEEMIAVAKALLP